MISQTGRYALHTLGYLVRNQDVMSRSAEISKATGIPSNYLSKILNRLRKQGIVEAAKGWGGGFRLRPEVLGRPIEEILSIFEGIGTDKQGGCLFGLPECDEDNPCPLHPYWDKIRSIHSEMTSSISVGDLGGTGK